jgi:hypothetical protein
MDEATTAREYWERASRPIEPSFGVDWEKSINRAVQSELDLPAMGPEPTGMREWAEPARRSRQPLSYGRELDREDINRGRDQFDRTLGDELDVRGKLNVAVEAPKGTEIKASGGGMFENNVTVDRKFGEPEAEQAI